ncbi:hypothetical protein G3T36_02195 [Diaminobutyricibacter tongyongensis]|uniref:Glycosyltransferase RgtA/B/C/D-like domain-containing protein n=1 Tax=Leifsonia tongyongensis TaxID=1268043 RepID=A0A6L9XTE6_9MICO|nr:hypothetical protein [Diaminobutyricibacter tongyongensis]NEN04671.1 hypothetical protein [Diaminobutyricibacter tongyongensis]
MFALVVSLVIGAVIAGLLSWRLQTLWPTAVSYVLHSIAAIGIYALLGPLAVPDADHYHKQAVQLLSGDSERSVTPGKELFTYLLRLVYSTIGIQPGIIIALNVLLVAAIPTIVGRTAAALNMPVQLTTWAGALVPQTFFWGVLLLRESMVWFALLLVILALAMLYDGARWVIWLPVLVGALVLFTYLRGTLAIVLAAAALIVLLLIVKSWKLTLGTAGALGVIALILPGFASILVKFGSDTDTAAARVSTTTSDAVAKASSMGAEHTSSTIFHAPHVGDGIVNLAVTKAVGLLNSTLGPLPWDFGRVGLPFFADGLIWVVVLALAIVGWVFLKDKRSAFVLVIPAALILLAMGWTLFEYGTVIRMRLMPLLILLPLAASGFLVFWRKIRRQNSAVEGSASEPARSE